MNEKIQSVGQTQFLQTKTITILKPNFATGLLLKTVKATTSGINAEPTQVDGPGPHFVQ